MTRKVFLLASLMCIASASACEPPARDLGSLAVEAGPSFDSVSQDLGALTVADSLYRDPTTGEAWTGAIFRPFSDDSSRVQIEGRLLEGTWDGDFRVYHRNGHIRYEGAFQNGQRCGPWTENADSVSDGSVSEALTRLVESMGIYPPCS